MFLIYQLLEYSFIHISHHAFYQIFKYFSYWMHVMNYVDTGHILSIDIIQVSLVFISKYRFYVMVMV